MEARARSHERRAGLGQDEECLQNAIAAAELYMQAAQKATAKEDKARLSRKCKEMITLAERLKLVAANPDPLGPKSIRELSTAEKVILLRASKIHGKTFPSWDLPPGPERFAKAADEPLFTDTAEYSFSPSQLELFDGWKRPVELVGAEEMDTADMEKLARDLMKATPDSDPVQDMVTDCSVVASLSAAMRHLCPGKDSLLGSLMYPFDHGSCMPALSPNGKYVFRMHFNGCFRQVTIDDRLPSSSSPSRALFVVDRRNPRLIWPALMEKAYLKVRGGYDFPGSNAGVDLYLLTGWIPEQLYLRDGDGDEFDINETWYSMKTSYDKGDVVATLGTPPLSAEEQAMTGLVSEHDYAVKDLKEDRGQRLLLVKNPWRNSSAVWRGAASSAPAVRSGSDDEETGTFWISLEDVLQYFRSLYLNWNPELFLFREDHHFTWEVPAKIVASAMTHNPQYTLTPSSSQPVWILLSRHWQDGELDLLREKLRTARGSLTSVSTTIGFMGLHVYCTSPIAGTRVVLPDRTPLYYKSPVDNQHTLLRLDEPIPNRDYTIVVTQALLPLPKYSFTLTVLSNIPLHFRRAPDPFPHVQSIASSWTRRTAGGSPSSGRYDTNPTWSITIPSPTRLSLLLTTSERDIPVCVSLAYPPTSSSPSPPSRRNIVIAAPEYLLGAAHAIANTPIPPGRYIMVASTFAAGQLAPFVLRIASDLPVVINPVASPEAGKLRTPAPKLVLGARRAVHVACVKVARLSRLSVVGRCEGRDVQVRISLVVGTKGPHRKVLAAVPKAEGEFIGCASGVRTEEVDVDPEVCREGVGVWVRVETLDGSGGGGCKLVIEVLSDHGADVTGGWVTEEEH